MPPRPAARVLVMALAAGCSSSTAVPDGAAAAADAPASTDGPRPDSPAPKADAPSPTADAPAPTADAPAASTYSTTFDATEAPISEGGVWTHVGQNWTLVDTGGGIAFGTQTGTGGYDDSYAHLSGFPPNHGASGVIFRSPSLDGVCGTHEVEIHLRWSDAAHDAHGYECNLAFDGSYAQIVRWNGPFGDFTYLGSGSVSGGVHSGETLACTIVGAKITLSVNGAEVATATDGNPFATGNPGMGFWRGSACGTTGDYGFTSYSATALP